MPEYNPTAAEQALAAQMESELRTVGLAIRAAPLLERRVLSQTALVLADTVAAACGETDIEAVLLAALVLAAHDRGHSALPVEHLSAFLPPRPRDGTALVPLAPDIWPEPTALDHSPLTTGTPAPLLRRTDSIEDLGDLWMTQRYDREEQWVADAIQALLKPIKEDDEDIFQLDGLSQTFGQELFYEPERPTWTHPARAVLEHLATRRFAILTGGPGTGKTYNIRRVLAAFHASALHQKRSIVIKLAAPTGKAGVRMRESIAKNLDGMRSAIEAAAQRSGAEVDADAVIEELGNHRSTTIHSMIGMRPTDGSARHGVDAPLAADLVIIDEASMVDLPMMRRLLHAIGPRTRLVLLGDRDQLPSVDVGTVLSDIVGPALGEVPSDLPVTALTENRRSSDAPTLALLVKKLQESDDASQALDILAGRTRAPVEPLPDRIRHRAPPEPRSGPAIPGTAGRHHELVQYLLEPWHRDTLTRATGEVVAKSGYLAELAALLKPAAESAPATHKYSRSMAWLEPIAQAAPALMSLFDRYRVLAVHRRGPLGVAGLNQAMEQSIRTFLDDALPKHTQHSLPRRAGKWLGQAILITRNDRSLDVYNGDVGLVLPDPSNGNALALALPKGPDDATPGALRYLSLDRLPEHQTAFAMTVHKSQGSQYDHVAVVLSTEPSSIQTRELVYTGITRASNRVTWVGLEEAMADALGRRVVRGSTLEARLTGRPAKKPKLPAPVPASYVSVASLPAQPDASKTVQIGHSTAAETPSPAAVLPDHYDGLHPFLLAHLRVDGVPVSRTELNKAAMTKRGMSVETIDVLLHSEPRVEHVARSWRLRETAPVKPGCPLDRATKAVLASETGLSSREIMAAAGLTKDEWNALRLALVHQPAVESVGFRHGARYLPKAYFEQRKAEIKQELWDRRGAEPREKTVLAALAEALGGLNER